MKYLLIPIVFFGVVLTPIRTLSAPVKSVVLSEEDVGTVNTSIGYSTVLQFDTRPTAAVLGDQDSYKVEYIGNGLTIKPLFAGAKTNLFVFTEYDRFNFKLVTTPAGLADYILKIKRKAPKGYPVEKSAYNSTDASSLNKKAVGKRAVCDNVFLQVNSIFWPDSDSTFILDFTVGAVTPGLIRNKIPFRALDFRILQRGKVIPMDAMYLGGLEVRSNLPKVLGKVVLRQNDFSKQLPVTLSFSPAVLGSKKYSCLLVSVRR